MRLDKLFLWFCGQPATPRLIGEMKLLAVGKGVSLTYAPSWLDAGFPLSEDLPLASGEFLPHDKAVAVGAVDDARPDRWGERVIQFVDKPARLSLMEYLYYTGDERFGALGVSTSATEYLPRRNGPLPRLENAQALSQVVAKINAREPLTALEKRMASAGGSFGGAKPKALIEIDGKEWLIKFFNNEPIDMPLVEHAAMTLAARAAIRVAETRVVTLLGEHAIAVKRFDRSGGSRIHCISAGTALKAMVADGQDADLGYPNLAQLLRRSGPTAGEANALDMQELFRRMVFNILIDNTDDHEKNHALMFSENTKQARLRLSPAYDVLPTNSGQGFQEFTVGADGRDSTLINAMSQCMLFGLPRDAAAQQVIEVISVVDTWQQHFRNCGVTGRDIDNLAERIDSADMVAMRRDFAAADHTRPRSNPRKRPFG